jgi:hypothetical protein
MSLLYLNFLTNLRLHGCTRWSRWCKLCHYRFTIKFLSHSKNNHEVSTTIE